MLYINFKYFCSLTDLNPFDYLPVTFHLKKGHQNKINGLLDSEFERFKQFYDNRKICNK